MTKPLTTCHLHEVSFGAQLVLDLLVKVFHGYQSGILVRHHDVRVSAAFEKALEALDELCQATSSAAPQATVCGPTKEEGL